MIPPAVLAQVLSLFFVSSAFCSTLIVDWGHDWGAGWYRETPDKPANPAQVLAQMDLNENGTTEDDYTGGWAYLWNETLSPTDPVYDYNLPTARFYGGAVIQITDIPKDEQGKPLRVKGATEGHINQNHELRDDWNLMAMPTIKREPERERFAGALLVFWKKEDFLNGGSSHRVSFQPGDTIAVFVSRYWGGINWGRWVVREGGKFYISKDTFAGETKPFDILQGEEHPNGARNPVVRRSHVIDPSKTEWAPYNPEEPWNIFFDVEAARFAPMEFKDVEAVGFLAQRDLAPGAPVAGGLWNLPHGLGEPVALKFNAVQVRATVHDIDGASPNLPMVALGGTPSSPALLMAETETTYRQWIDVWRWAVTNQRARNFPEGLENLEIPGYSFWRDGSMGSMRTLVDGVFTPGEPVTDLSWFDAALWCNALSELEGLEPAYYEDSTFEVPLRVIFNRAVLEKMDERPVVYWKKDAGGYRLPTAAEWAWAATAGGQSAAGPVEAGAWIGANSAGRTHPVGEKEANPFGLRDMFGNVWEWVWDVSGDTMDPAVSHTRTVLGGSFRYPADDNAGSLLPFGEMPAEGSPTIGFRVVRNGPNTAALAGIESKVAVPERAVAIDLVVPPVQPMTVEALRKRVVETLNPVPVEGTLPDNETHNKIYKEGEAYPAKMASVPVPYSLWALVRNWAEREKNYRFNYQGDMGSTRYTAAENPSHTAAEPVTHLAWSDAVVWSNALSELMGLEPVYTSKEGGEVVRLSPPFRVPMYANYAYANLGNYHGREVDTGAIIDWKASASKNGFRIPTQEEYQKADEVSKREEAGWFSTNSGGKTHPVGTREANPSGIYDLEGNVTEWTYGGDGLFGQLRHGNNFGYPPGAYPHQMNSKEHWSVGRPYVGFRVIQRAGE